MTAGTHRSIHFNERVLEVLIGGTSLLDVREGIAGAYPDSESITAFIEAYGYDLSDPVEAGELHGHKLEAIQFIRKYFLKPANPEGIDADIPRKIVENPDVRDLFKWASGQGEFRRWSCAILRVMHILAHIDRDVRTPYFGEIQNQIFDRVYRYLHRDDQGRLFLQRASDDPYRVELVEFQVKPKKPRESTLIKLLHKPESVAEELFDRIGMRFITRTRFDAVCVVRFLEESRAIVAANIKPSRSRNTLMEIKEFREWIRRQTEQTFDRMVPSDHPEIEALPFPESKNENRHSSDHYRAIQFTCRQLIKVKQALPDQIRDLKKSLKKAQIDPEISKALDQMDLKNTQRVVRFFYPFEIQVVDQKSFESNEKGRSAHAEYKKAQVKAAMHRVFGGGFDSA